MRRISAKYARLGMKLGYPVYDNYGTKLLSSRIELDEDSLQLLRNSAIAEIFIEDSRVSDISAGPLISPEIEGKVVQSLRNLNRETVGKINISDKDIVEISARARVMAEEITIKKIGEVSVASIVLPESYYYVQPVKTAVISMVLGHTLGYSIATLTSLVIAALLKDIGYALLPQDLIQKPGVLTEEELAKMQQHPDYGYKLVRQLSSCRGDIASAILQHHELWNGKGYPQGLNGANISRFAQIISVADKYTAVVSKRPGNKKIYMPHEAMQFVIDHSGEYFNPEIVELFVRWVPCYSSGLTVKLNTGETGIVSDSKLGFIGRPVVRIFFDNEGKPIKNWKEIEAEYFTLPHSNTNQGLNDPIIVNNYEISGLRYLKRGTFSINELDQDILDKLSA
jgi:HD-GYP domain-containing protein (c-di-GMP phosphodiesterase class II)